ncbi:GMC family oxidoreductase N-terminal domain-containing protein [Methanobrevibacter sp. OttesenSCG-928-K11]|nr:GMC family oxidoreductase N-terminal domain-containing protein [Methanobrevibacter sp. OttesenSCG-928-K11]MDL2271073.1 GMC family oxidoreductase N-terminal domain-containing protein [Methanobrevibacter sp. OttesenSCG-928-I08]
MVIIVGSGAGGGLLAMEFALANIPVTLIEKGPFIKSGDAFKYYDESDEGVDLLKTSCLGGSTLVSAGNGVRTLETDLKDLGIDLSKEFDEIEKLINIHELNDSHHGKASKLFLKAGKKLNLNPIKMPKFIEEDKCNQCGNCAFGCPRDAKWSSKDFIEIAKYHGAEILTNTEVTDLIIENEIVKGVKALDKDGNNIDLFSDIVILSAGAISSAIILQKAGIPAGEKLFTDPFVTVGGVLKDTNLVKEVQMNALIKKDNFILSPHYSTLIPKELENVNEKDIFSIMVKIPDDGLGYIKNNKVVKINSINDSCYISEGSTTAGFILREIGVDPNTIVSTHLRSAHPGGTAAIGEIVNNHLETKIKGLFVCDASVLPKSPGSPPILTILALSKKLSKYLIK